MNEVQLFQLPDAAIHALADGNLEAASDLAGLNLPQYFTGPDSIHTWVMRSKQLDADPECAPWITRAIVDTTTGAVVGRAGFHGPPDPDGMVEVGYAVDPTHRRRGYARAAFEALLNRARTEPTVTTLRATIRPDNTASLNLIAAYGFTENGEQWDDVDGREIIYELDVR
ncbi:GNAT family N-acetyltransferase [Stackebrandtia nassauensis]|uniref:GCN5-related N-acetyltransferase n=1 Tax=Stackebrandtia nassauensis (strain DSM 44728 / CIP 108903 / NRRL B-16338 / NBRC 102104 / LLR-40K-21) TaxID=446470 RepID=D3Q3R3_STANL|nr:GNAT family N-acetyltransferase [Stackebrandtia nassauensis]ADD43980.1 GCN5-related N-acetyltransferase [Stackebrandtia nassauensis DSM 44728]